MIAIDIAILFSLYYMIIGVFISTHARKILKPTNNKESLGATALVIVWPIVLIFYPIVLIFYAVGFIEGMTKAIKKQIKGQ
jgi:hypothetical protein